MGRSTMRRRRSRAGRLAELASTDRGRFEQAWERRLQSWAVEAWRIAQDSDRSWSGERRAFAVLDRALEELWLCGDDVYRRYAPSTRDFLGHEATKAVRVADRRAAQGGR